MNATPNTTTRVPLAALRMRLDEGSTGTRWLVNPDGVLGRALLIPARGTASFPLGLDHDVTLTGRTMLLPHDWRDGRAALRVSVAVTTSRGDHKEVWNGTLRADDRGRPRGFSVRCTVPAWSTAVELRVEREADQPRAIARAIWVEPALTDPGAPPGPTPSGKPTAASTGEPPLISVLTPVHDPPLPMLREAVDSVRNQTYTNWELQLVDDGSTNPDVITTLEHYAETDPRIHLTRRDTAGGISTATNTALAHASGAYIALLDHDDTLTPDALQHIADHISAQPDLDMLYSDEDIVLNGARVWAHLKPAWSPDTLRTNGYTCHLGVYRRSLLQEIGGFRTEYNGSQDVDMILRLTERTDRIAHVPRILYHWRAHPDSTAGGDAKPYAFVAARNAIAAHLGRVGLEAEVGYGPPGLYRVAHRVDPATSVDIVLTAQDPAALTHAAASWQRQPHPTWHIVLAAPRTVIAAADLDPDRTTAIPIPEQTPPAAALAHAADAATAEHLILMHAPASALTHDWLTRLIGYAAQPGIAAAGPILIAPDGRIQHAGIALPDGLALHLLHGTRSSMDDFFGYGTSVYNVSAVSGMLATPRATYAAAGGLDPGYGVLSLIEYCLRARETGGRVVIVPDARLRTTEPEPPNDLPALWRLRNRWTATHTHDPYYNPNYRTDRGDFEIAR